MKKAFFKSVISSPPNKNNRKEKKVDALKLGFHAWMDASYPIEPK